MLKYLLILCQWWSHSRSFANRSYPEDIVNEVHIDGLIAGTVWDLWNILVQDDPEEGTNTPTRLLVEATSMGPEICYKLRSICLLTMMMAILMEPPINAC